MVQYTNDLLDAEINQLNEEDTDIDTDLDTDIDTNDDENNIDDIIKSIQVRAN